MRTWASARVNKTANAAEPPSPALIGRWTATESVIPVLPGTRSERPTQGLAQPVVRAVVALKIFRMAAESDAGLGCAERLQSDGVGQGDGQSRSVVHHGMFDRTKWLCHARAGRAVALSLQLALFLPFQKRSLYHARGTLEVTEAA